ncbi:MAG TPA: outer membrane lipoprotein carrier protein LolA [Bacteroidales bacterium]|nr:outer membrane lipoprotein carrier protein LolA [Bacteroidales bacterium]HQL70140.1 outer membrane lipoprotein carrier protein LolA [Bacteroidales bacterium]
MTKIQLLKHLSLLICLLSIVVSVNSQTYTPATKSQIQEISANIQKTASNTSTIESRFVQKKTLSVLSETVTSDGIMYYKKEDNLRWQYNKPYSYIFILSSGKVYIKNDNKVNSFDTESNKLFKEISRIMIGSVRGNLLSQNNDFTIQYYWSSKTVMVSLTPKSGELKKLMSLVKLTFSTSDWLVQSIELIESGGDNTIITFTEKNVNKGIPDTMFRLN